VNIRAASLGVEPLSLKGVLTIRGYDIEEIASKISLEEAAYLLWHGKLPTQSELDAQNERLISYIDAPRKCTGNGWPFTFRNELRGLNLATLERLNATRASIIVGNESPAAQQLREALSGSPIAPDWNVSAAAAQWNSDKAMNTATVPADLLKLVQTKVMEPA
jgi:citrate synthase